MAMVRAAHPGSGRTRAVPKDWAAKQAEVWSFDDEVVIRRTPSARAFDDEKGHTVSEPGAVVYTGPASVCLRAERIGGDARAGLEKVPAAVYVVTLPNECGIDESVIDCLVRVGTCVADPTLAGALLKVDQMERGTHMNRVLHATLTH